MKRFLLLILLCYPLISNAGFCVGGPYYKIITYDSQKIEVTIKGGGFYDFFLSGPFLKTNNINFIDNHHYNSAFKFCKYENFDKLNKLSFIDLYKDDKIILIGNVVILNIISLIIFFLIMLYKRSKNKIIIKQIILILLVIIFIIQLLQLIF